MCMCLYELIVPLGFYGRTIYFYNVYSWRILVLNVLFGRFEFIDGTYIARWRPARRFYHLVHVRYQNRRQTFHSLESYSLISIKQFNINVMLQNLLHFKINSWGKMGRCVQSISNSSISYQILTYEAIFIKVILFYFAKF